MEITESGFECYIGNGQEMFQKANFQAGIQDLTFLTSLKDGLLLAR